MNRVTTTVYLVLAVILEAMLAGAYRGATPALRHVYSMVFGQDPILPPITAFVLARNWLLYLPPGLLAIAGMIAWVRPNAAIAQHALFWCMALFLAVGAVHAVALFLPFVVTIHRI